MARRHRLQFADGIYHVTFRGNGRRDMFHATLDYERLTARVAESAKDFVVEKQHDERWKTVKNLGFDPESTPQNPLKIHF